MQMSKIKTYTTKDFLKVCKIINALGSMKGINVYNIYIINP